MSLNPDTRISVHCYAGDARQVTEMLPHHKLHECPITILSPTDAPVNMEGPDIDSKTGGRQQSIGELSIQRQRSHMHMLLEYPENHFLMHDADSICLSPKIPDYLYAEPDVVWSNIVWIEDPGERRECDSRSLPHLAFQPPYFLSRRTLETILKAGMPHYRNSFDGFIDHYMMRVAVEAGLVWKGFHGGISCALSLDNNDFQRSQVKVRHTGSIFVHGVKTPRFWQPLVAAHQAFVADCRPAGDGRPATERLTTIAKPLAHEFVRPSMQNDKITYHRNGEIPPSRPQQRRPRPLSVQGVRGVRA